MDKKLTGYPSIDKPWLKYYQKDIPALPDVDQGMYLFLKENNSAHLENIALNYFGNKISFGEMFENIDKVADALKVHGVRKGDIVSVCPLNCPEFFYLFYAINKVGAVSNWIGLTSSEVDLREQLKSTRSTMVFTVSVAYENIIKATEGTEVRLIINVPIENSMPFLMKSVVRAKGIMKRHTRYEWQTFLKIATVKNNVDIVSGSELALIEYTGGSTGIPKGVMLNNKAMNSYYANFYGANYCGLSAYKRNDRYLCAVPLFLALGISACCHGPLCHGMELVLAPDPSPKAGTKIIIRSKVNHLVCGRQHVEGLLAEVKNTSIDLSHISSIMYGGEETNKTWENMIKEKLKHNKMNAPVLNGYGMTESAAAIFIELDDGIDGLIPLANVNAKIVDPNDCSIEYGYDVEGELCISTDTIMQGYYKKEQESTDILFEENGVKWMKTHDLAKISRDGHIKITGRIKRIYCKLDSDDITIRVYPMRIEETIQKVNEVKACAVVGVKDDVIVYRTIAYIIPENISGDKEILRNQIEAICCKELPKSHVPDEYIFVDSFPLTRAGKVDYRSLEGMAIQELTI